MTGFATLAIFASLGGILLARMAWTGHDWARLCKIGAPVLIAVSLALWIAGFGAEIGIPLALELGALLGLGFILTRMEIRERRMPRERTVAAPPRIRHARLRGIVRFLIGGPLGLIAALGIGILVATQAPMAEDTRLILGGLIVPSLWCVGIAWTASDRRLLPQSIAFALTGVLGFGIALFPGA